MLGKLINTYHVYTARMSLALNGSSVLQHFEHSNAIEIRYRIMFDFYPGLPHLLTISKHEVSYLQFIPEMLAIDTFVKLCNIVVIWTHSLATHGLAL